MKRRTRLVLLCLLLALSLLALRHRAAIQVRLYGVDEGVRSLVDRPAPALPASLRTLDGRPFALADLRGRVVLLHFWTYG